MYANIMIPSNEITDFSEGEVPRIYESSMDAITRGTRDGVDIAVNVGAILVVFIALVYLVDSVLGLLPSIAGREVSLIEGDLTDHKDLSGIFSKHSRINSVIHFAALKAVGESTKEPLLYYRNNVAGSIALLEQMQNHGAVSYTHLRAHETP